ncbi:serine/arginine repetitive matrix protein 2 [Triticum aestivum]|uniref:serine/arginine repetitive matrix protein 2 n=1 Tax=Triticum aestivum TaxID=4565 RepID=UPI001D021EEC|nr:serine/arginine repetitive matrix protein 2-like [Triticum aestivum]
MASTIRPGMDAAEAKRSPGEEGEGSRTVAPKKLTGCHGVRVVVGPPTSLPAAVACEKTEDWVAVVSRRRAPRPTCPPPSRPSRADAAVRTKAAPPTLVKASYGDENLFNILRSGECARAWAPSSKSVTGGKNPIFKASFADVVKNNVHGARKMPITGRAGAADVKTRSTATPHGEEDALERPISAAVNMAVKKQLPFSANIRTVGAQARGRSKSPVTGAKETVRKASFADVVKRNIHLAHKTPITGDEDGGAVGVMNTHSTTKAYGEKDLISAGDAAFKGQEFASEKDLVTAGDAAFKGHEFASAADDAVTTGDAPRSRSRSSRPRPTTRSPPGTPRSRSRSSRPRPTTRSPPGTPRSRSRSSRPRPTKRPRRSPSQRARMQRSRCPSQGSRTRQLRGKASSPQRTSCSKSKRPSVASRRRSTWTRTRQEWWTTLASGEMYRQEVMIPPGSCLAMGVAVQPRSSQGLAMRAAIPWGSSQGMAVAMAAAAAAAAAGLVSVHVCILFHLRSAAWCGQAITGARTSPRTTADCACKYGVATASARVAREATWPISRCHKSQGISPSFSCQFRLCSAIIRGFSRVPAGQGTIRLSTTSLSYSILSMAVCTSLYMSTV